MIKNFPTPDAKRLREQAALIRLTWAHSNHPTTNLQMHAALRCLGVPNSERPRTVAEFRERWSNVNAERAKERANPPVVINVDWNRVEAKGTVPWKSDCRIDSTLP